MFMKLERILVEKVFSCEGFSRKNSRLISSICKKKIFPVIVYTALPPPPPSQFSSPFCFHLEKKGYGSKRKWYLP